MDLMALVRLILKEASNRKGLVVSLFALVSLAVLTAGLYWPKTYVSSTTILFDESNIIRPLMQGAAEATSVVDLARNASDLLFTRAVMNEILDAGGWVDENTSLVEREKLVREIQGRSLIDKVGPNLILIEYRDSNPERAYVTTKRFAELFMSLSAEAKKEETREAYEFIDSQVQEYHAKLRRAEERLKDFRTANVDARPGSQNEVNQRIVGLRRATQDLELQLEEATIKRDALQSQLSGEAVLTANMMRKNEIYDRIRQLQGQLDTLRLSYLDTYPDIVRLKNQIADLQSAAEEDPSASGLVYMSPEGEDGLRTSVLYDEIKRQLATEETNILTLRNRIDHNRQLLQAEGARASRIELSETELAELTRDYEVNRQLYRELLSRREKAHVSLNLEMDQKGLTFKVQEPANLPLLPVGLRFLHFALIGPLLGLAVPLGLVFALLQIDPRIRSEEILAERTGVPVVASFHHMMSRGERAARQGGILLAAVVVVAVLCAYGMVGWMKITGAPMEWLPTIGVAI